MSLILESQTRLWDVLCIMHGALFQATRERRNFFQVYDDAQLRPCETLYRPKMTCSHFLLDAFLCSGPKELRIFKLPKEESAVKVTQPTFVVKGEAPRFKGEITDHVWLVSLCLRHI